MKRGNRRWILAIILCCTTSSWVSAQERWQEIEQLFTQKQDWETTGALYLNDTGTTYTRSQIQLRYAGNQAPENLDVYSMNNSDQIYVENHPGNRGRTRLFKVNDKIRMVGFGFNYIVVAEPLYDKSGLERAGSFKNFKARLPSKEALEDVRIRYKAKSAIPLQVVRIAPIPQNINDEFSGVGLGSFVDGRITDYVEDDTGSTVTAKGKSGKLYELPVISVEEWNTSSEHYMLKDIQPVNEVE